MKKLLLVLLLPISNCLVAQVTYVNYFDAIYPYVVNQANYYPFFDVNQDGIGDFRVQTNNSNYISFTANGQNKLKTSASGIALDCTNDTINGVDFWSSQATVAGSSYYISIGPNKQGFKLLLTNPANGALGAKYGYIDYTFSSDHDVIIHGFYYQNTFNAPIWANSQLTFPSSLNCLQIDTVTVYDTITTNVTIYDTITTNITTYDTLLVSVTDTLFINT